jgi:hypothetical protein
LDKVINLIWVLECFFRTLVWILRKLDTEIFVLFSLVSCWLFLCILAVCHCCGPLILFTYQSIKEMNEIVIVFYVFCCFGFQEFA